MSSQIVRLRRLEELLLNTTRLWSRSELIAYYEDRYQKSKETVSDDIRLYNDLLNEYHNPEYSEYDKFSQIKYCFWNKSLKCYQLLSNSAGVYYTYFNHSQRFFHNDLNQLEYLIDVNRSFFDQNFINLFKVFKDNEDRKSDPLRWDPVVLNKVTPIGNDKSFGVFLRAIREKQPVEITYGNLSPNQSLVQYNLYPLMLREYTNGWITGWYLLAVVIEDFPQRLQLKLNKIRVFALDRITRVNLLEYRPQVVFEKGFNPADYFKYTMGISRFNLIKIVENMKITIETINKEKVWIYDYLKKYPFHSTQKIVEDNSETKYLKFSIQVEENWELEQFLLKYANEIRVVSPQRVRDQIESLLEEGLRYYGEI